MVQDMKQDARHPLKSIETGHTEPMAASGLPAAGTYALDPAHTFVDLWIEIDSELRCAEQPK